MIKKMQGVDTSNALLHTLIHQLPLEVEFTNGAKVIFTEYGYSISTDGKVELMIILRE